ncbi:hypothetical protein EV696_11188 [Permianibacter aggregans]|uniref:Uncharacterized protein n=1 Tax=Permianibacter aggregans TaxID=1510150 RepID=A0A4R6UJN4_9GAMM|nr:hypothetical protein EV696_11188 [Permianibacter aggregans]
MPYNAAFNALPSVARIGLLYGQPISFALELS